MSRVCFATNPLRLFTAAPVSSKLQISPRKSDPVSTTSKRKKTACRPLCFQRKISSPGSCCRKSMDEGVLPLMSRGQSCTSYCLQTTSSHKTIMTSWTTSLWDQVSVKETLLQKARIYVHPPATWQQEAWRQNDRKLVEGNSMIAQYKRGNVCQATAARAIMTWYSLLLQSSSNTLADFLI